MKIGFNSSFSNVKFGAKSKEVRLADDIQRKAKLVFPFFSSTYVDEFYNSVNDEKDSYSTRAEDLRRNIMFKIGKTRDTRSDFVDERFIRKSYDDAADDFIVSYFKWNKSNPKISRLGNCGENSKLALAALLANGYYNSSIVSLCYKASMMDKKTERPVASKEIDIDHAFVVTDMNTEGKKTIVVDPWLGFADDKKRALDIFNGYFKGEETKEAEKNCVEVFKRKMDLNGVKYNPKDYYLKTGFVFRPKSFHKGDEIKHITGRQLREEFPELIVGEIEKQ